MEELAYRLFDANGHLTQGTLEVLSAGQLDDAYGYEAAEHLSYCDGCLSRYTTLLCDGALLDPPVPAAPAVMSRIHKQSRIVFLHQYGYMAVAATLTFLLWTGGFFTPDITEHNEAFFENVKSAVDQISQKTEEIKSNLAAEVENWFHSIQWRGEQTQ